MGIGLFNRFRERLSDVVVVSGDRNVRVCRERICVYTGRNT
jgi:hypothetical protein